MYLVTYEEDGCLYRQSHSTLAEAVRFAQDCAHDGVDATLCLELREFPAGAGPSLEEEYALCPGRDYPGSFGGCLPERRRMMHEDSSYLWS